MAIKDYSTTPDMNTSISGINIAEGCAPSGINNAIRQLMADVKAEKDARDAELSANAASQSTRDAAQDAAISEAQTAANNAVNGALISAVIEDGELVLTYGNGSVKRESLPGGLPLGTLMPYTGKDVPAGFLRADGSTYSNMRASFPEFYDWVVESGLTVPLGSYALVEGSCGFYGLDTSTGTVRMPTLAAGVFGTTAAGQYGAAVGAGLPNITGKTTGMLNCYSFSASGAMQFTELGNYYNGISSNQKSSSLSFDASRSNPIYGASDTVQPPHVKYPWVISVYNAAVAPSVAEASQFVGLLDGKADRSSVEAIKAYIVETWQSGTEWYRKWSDGWIEQGGFIPADNAQLNNFSVTLPKAMTTATYTINVTPQSIERNNTYFAYAIMFSVASVSTTGFKAFLYGSSAEDRTNGMFWTVKGKEVSHG